MGRKVFQPEIKVLGDELARRVVDVFKRCLSLMREDTGVSNIQSSRILWEFKKQQEDHLSKHPLQYRSGELRLSIMSEPQSEQDVIALFHELLGIGLLQGLGIYATSESEKYDCIFQTDVTGREQVYSDDQPLGVSERALDEGQSPPWVLEYKFDSDSLIADFNKELKHVSDVRLLVCWSIGPKTRSELTLRPYLAGDEGTTSRYSAPLTRRTRTVSCASTLSLFKICSHTFRILLGGLRVNDSCICRDFWRTLLEFFG